MPHYLKSETVPKLGFSSVTSYTVAGTAEKSDGETIDCTQLSGHVIKLNTSAGPTAFNLANYTPGVVLHFVVTSRSNDIIIMAPSGANINGNSSIDLSSYTTDATSLIISDSTNAYSSGVIV
jgi:hypothetical protein